MQFLREEREERKYIHLRREEGQKTKKKEIAPYLARAFTPSPEYYKKRWHSLYKSTPPRRQKRRPPPRRRPRSRRCARVSFARVFFRPDSDFFFSSLSPKMGVFFKGRRKNATKKRTKKAQHSHLRVYAHSPPKTALSTPSNARIERRNVPGVHRCAL